MRQGFSLIELMVVIAIVAVLAAVAVPAYKDYILRTNMTKIVSTVDALFEHAQVYHATNGAWPQDSDDISMLAIFENDEVEGFLPGSFKSIFTEGSSLTCNYFGINATIDGEHFDGLVNKSQIFFYIGEDIDTGVMSTSCWMDDKGANVPGYLKCTYEEEDDFKADTGGNTCPLG